MGKVETATRFVIGIANDPIHGYSQINRWGPDYDCSSLLITAFEKAGIPVKTNGATYTGNMYAVFTKTGFKDVTSSVNLRTGAGLKRGDVLLNHKRHTAIYIGNHQTAEASIDERGGIYGRQRGDQTGREILIRRYRNYPWNCVLRYVGDNKQTSKEASKSSSSKVSGAKFIKYEKWHGLTQDVCNVRSAPSTSARVVDYYNIGQTIYYDQVWEGDGYRWISYVSYSGVRRFVAYRRLNGDTTPWIKF